MYICVYAYIKPHKYLNTHIALPVLCSLAYGFADNFSKARWLPLHSRGKVSSMLAREEAEDQRWGWADQVGSLIKVQGLYTAVSS